MSWEAGNGTRPREKPRSGRMILPPSFSTSTHSAPRARGTLQVRCARLRGLRRRLRFRGDARSGCRHRGRHRRPTSASPWTASSAVTWASARPKSHCAPHSSRSPRQAGRGARADDAAGRAAFPDVLRPLCRLAGEARGTVSLSLDRGDESRRSKASPTAASTWSSARTSSSSPTSSSSGLGLVIIDEEHRFGVRQKERLKRLRAEVDVLTLTATPIPRTLAMSLEGLRDFSVIATAPERRLAIKTFVAPYSSGIVREAVLARAQARRPDLFPAQRHRHDLHHGRELAALVARGADRDRPRPDAGARTRARDARLLSAAEQSPAVFDHHRDRASTCRPPTPSSFTAPTASASRSSTSCAAVSAARTTRRMRTC